MGKFDIQNSFEAIGLLMLFITFFYENRYSIIQKTLDSIPPDKEKRNEFQRYQTLIKRVILLDALPLTLLIGFTVYIILPMAVSIIRLSSVALWNFDFFLTAFIFVFVFCIYLFTTSVMFIVKLLCSLSQ